MGEKPKTDGAYWKVGFALLVLSFVGAALLLPYATTLASKTLAETAAQRHVSVNTLLAISLAQSAVLLVVAVFAGLWAARKLGLGAPLLRAWFARAELPPRTGATFVFAAVAGVATGAALIALDRYGFAPIPSVAAFIAKTGAAAIHPAPWQGFLASFYGAFDEEILMRLGLLSLLALALRTFVRWRGGDPSVALPGGVFWAANILAALLFGAGHLPAASAIAPLTAALVVRIVSLNAFAGIVFGWFYRRFGLEWAMSAHFAGDLVLHAVTG